MIHQTEQNQAFSPAQLHILQLMSYCKTEEAIEELDSVISRYYEEKLQKEADRLWDEGPLNAEAIDGLLQQHLRSPYTTRV